jgi:hypothetical protein
MNRPMVTAISVMDGLFSTPKSAVYAKTSGEVEYHPSYTFRVVGNKCTTHTLQQMETMKVT